MLLIDAALGEGIRRPKRASKQARIILVARKRRFRLQDQYFIRPPLWDGQHVDDSYEHARTWSPLLVPSHTPAVLSAAMAGGKPLYRHLSRSSSHRQALLRNLVTSLFTHESIRTTWPKAKEAQRLAEKLITLGKKNTAASRRRAQEIFFVRFLIFPSLSVTARYSTRLTGNVDRIDTPRTTSQALWPATREIRQSSWWLHARASP